MSFIPAGNICSPQGMTGSDVEDNYLTNLLVERQNLEPLFPLFPNCIRLLDQEIFGVSGRLASHRLNEYGMSPFHSPLPLHAPSLAIFPDMMLDMAGSSNWNGNCWNNVHPEQGFSVPPGAFMDWQSVPGSSSSTSRVKKTLRIDVPVNQYPNFNFVGRLIGPRGRSLKRIEVATGCQILIRGKGSVKDQDKEERLRGQPGHEHLNEPLHIIVEVNSPEDVADGQLRLAKEIIQEILTPVESSQDVYKQEQLRELAIINSTQG